MENISFGMDAPMRIKDAAARLRDERVSPCRLWRGGLLPLTQILPQSLLSFQLKTESRGSLLHQHPPILQPMQSLPLLVYVCDTNSFSSTDPSSAVSRR